MEEYKPKRPLIGPYLEKGTKQFKKRLRTKIKHLPEAFPGTSRKPCVRCCAKCHGRRDCTGPRSGRNTRYKCSVCNVALCYHCFDDFHEKEVITMPVCYRPFKRGKLANDGSSECIVIEEGKSRKDAVLNGDVKGKSKRKGWKGRQVEV